MVLHDGRTLDRCQLFHECLCLNPSCSLLMSVATILSDGEIVVLPNEGRALNKRGLLLEALFPNDARSYSTLSCSLEDGESVVLPNGRTLDKQDLILEALRCNPNDSYLYQDLADTMPEWDTRIALPDGRVLDSSGLLLNAVRCDPSNRVASWSLRASLSPRYPWSHLFHSLILRTMPVNVLFATLLLGLQRLEMAGTLLSAHHSMLEDMLEAWTWGDTNSLGSLSDIRAVSDMVGPFW